MTTPAITLADGAQFTGTVDPERTESAMHVARYRAKQAYGPTVRAIAVGVLLPGPDPDRQPSNLLLQERGDDLPATAQDAAPAPARRASGARTSFHIREKRLVHRAGNRFGR